MPKKAPISNTHRVRSLSFAGGCMTFSFLVGASLAQTFVLQIALGLLFLLGGALFYGQIAKIFGFWPLHKSNHVSEHLTIEDLRIIHRVLQEESETHALKPTMHADLSPSPAPHAFVPKKPPKRPRSPCSVECSAERILHVKSGTKRQWF